MSLLSPMHMQDEARPLCPPAPLRPTKLESAPHRHRTPPPRQAAPPRVAKPRRRLSPCCLQAAPEGTLQRSKPRSGAPLELRSNRGTARTAGEERAAQLEPAPTTPLSPARLSLPPSREAKQLSPAAARAARWRRQIFLEGYWLSYHIKMQLLLIQTYT